MRQRRTEGGEEKEAEAKGKSVWGKTERGARGNRLQEARKEKNREI